MSFWRWLKGYAEARIEKAHTKKHGCDVKCPHCKNWWSQTEGRFINRTAYRLTSVPGHLSIYECGKCYSDSYWNFGIAPVPLLESSTYREEWRPQ